LYNLSVDIVPDASAFLAVVLDEAGREWVIERTSDCGLVSPEILPYEIANALIAVQRKGRLTDREALKAFDISQRIPVKLVSVKIRDALRMAVKHGIHAYDAFYLQCCIETKLPLISLDNRMCEVAGSLSIKVVT
jgi:predicted nucleic acid-binding protein